jgi:hypothetical protein
MKKSLFLDCNDVMDIIYESEKDSFLPFLSQLRLNFHFLFCSDCAEKLKTLREIEDIMKTDFLPQSPDFADILMERLGEETHPEEEKIAAPAGFSFRSWVIIGFFMLLALPSSFFGMNFIEIANAEGLSFLLPLGITIGIVVTCYGALFIGSHLKELSNRFGIR